MFEVQGVYANRKGKYTVLAIHPPKMSVRYEDGSQAELNMNMQSRIWENIVVEQEAKQAKVASRLARKGASQTRFYIKAISIPDAAELMFPGWHEKVIMAANVNINQVKIGTRILYYAIEPQVFFAVATVTGAAFAANPKEYFFTNDLAKANFFPVDMDAFAVTLSHGVSSDSVDMESYPALRKMTIQPESFLEISEDDFELLSEILTEVSEDEIEEGENDDFEEEDDE